MIAKANGPHGHLVWLTLLGLAACVSTAPVVYNQHGASALLSQASHIVAAAVIRLPDRDVVFRLSDNDIASLQMALTRVNVSTGFHAGSPPWNVILLLKTSEGSEFAVHPIDAVLRVNAADPWSTAIANEEGQVMTDVVVDLQLHVDDWMWLRKLLNDKVGPLDNRESGLPFRRQQE